MLFDIIGNFTDVSKPNEIFAYSIKSEIGNNSNEFTKAVLECTIRRIYAETN